MNAADNLQVTPLQLASYYGRMQIASLLIHRNAQVTNTGVEYANTPLHRYGSSVDAFLRDLSFVSSSQNLFVAFGRGKRTSF